MIDYNECIDSNKKMFFKVNDNNNFKKYTKIYKKSQQFNGHKV